MSSQNHLEFDAQNYPRVYKPGNSFKWPQYTTGLFILGLCLTGVYDGIKHMPAVPFWSGNGGVGAFCSGFAALFIVSGFFTRLVLHADRAEYRTVFGKKTMLRENIAGARLLNRGDTRLVLIPKPGLKKYISIAAAFDEDQYYMSWVNSLPYVENVKR